jgi:hypothetical protein
MMTRISDVIPRTNRLRVAMDSGGSNVSRNIHLGNNTGRPCVVYDGVQVNYLGTLGLYALPLIFVVFADTILLL